MLQRAVAAFGFDHDRVQFGAGQPHIGFRIAHMALLVDMHAGPAQRNPNMVGTAFACASRQREQRAEGAVVAGRVVAGGGRQQLRPLIAVVEAYPGRALGDLLPSAAVRERAAVAVAADG